jgi:hypothetical protein
VTDNHVSGSTVNAIGAGIKASGGGSLTIRRALLTDNGAYRGAAIFHNGPLLLADSTVSANTAAGSAVLTPTASCWSSAAPSTATPVGFSSWMAEPSRTRP